MSRALIATTVFSSFAILASCSGGDNDSEELADAGNGNVPGIDGAVGVPDADVQGAPDGSVDETCTSDWCALATAPSSRGLTVTPAGQPWVLVGRGADERRAGAWVHHEPSWDHPSDPFLGLGVMYEIQSFSENDVWVGGELGYVGHWNGSTWTEHRPIAPTARGIWGSSPSDIWFLYDTGRRHRWNGDELLSSGSSEIKYLGAWGASANNVWGYGRGQNVPYVPALDHWNGTTWESELLPGNGKVVSFWASGPEDLWAVISDGRLLHGNATTWTEVALPTNLKSIWGQSANDIWVVGQGGAILHYNGSSWNASPSGTTETLTHIEGKGGAIWAVGDEVALRKI